MLIVCHFVIKIVSFISKKNIIIIIIIVIIIIIIIIIIISKGFLKQLTIKTNGKNSRRFDCSSVIIKRNVANMNLHRYIK